MAAINGERAALRVRILVGRNFNFNVSTRSRRIYSRYNLLNESEQSGPLLIAENHKRYVQVFQVLLEADILVGGHQNVETCCLSSHYKVAVKQPVLSALICFNDYVAFERMPEWSWNAVIKEYEHRAPGCKPLAAERRGFAPRIP